MILLKLIEPMVIKRTKNTDKADININLLLIELPEKLRNELSEGMKKQNLLGEK